MKNTNCENKNFKEMTTEQTHRIANVAEQLLTAAGKVIDAGQDLNAVRACMLHSADNAKADARGLNHACHILAWASWMGDITSDLLDTADEISCAFHDLIDPNPGEKREEYSNGQV